MELRMRLKHPLVIIAANKIWKSKRCIDASDISFVMNVSSQYSPWAATTLSKGYLTVAGGHRIGVSGDAVIKDGQINGFRTVSSLCIRIARDIRGIAPAEGERGSVLILGAPGWGKTSLLRDLIRRRSRLEQVSVVDERGEIFPKHFDTGYYTDILRGTSKAQGIEMMLRTMGPKCIAVDEITAPEDAKAILNAAGCGVALIATAHAASVSDFKNRPVNKPLIESRIFDTVIMLAPDRSYRLERMVQ